MSHELIDTTHNGHMLYDLVDGEQPEEENLPGQSPGHWQGLGKKGTYWTSDFLQGSAWICTEVRASQNREPAH